MNEHPKTDDAKDESKETFYKLRDEEIRALCDKSLTHGAARLFVLISKLVWFPNYGGMFKGMIGTLKCSVADLARYLGCNEKSFYRDAQKNRAGWLELLTNGNYLWITKHTISNGEAMNVYHITAVRPRNEQVTFGFASRFHDHTPTGVNGNGHFSVSNGRGNSELEQTGTEDPIKRELGTGVNGNSALVKTGVGSWPKRILPVTDSTSDPLAKTDTANPHLHQSPTGENGNSQLAKTGDYKKSVTREESKEDKNKGDSTPRNELETAAFSEGDTGFADYCDSWKLKTAANPNGEYRGKLVKELSRCRLKLHISPGPFWQRRADFLQTELDGGKAPKPQAGPARAVKPAPALRKMTEAEHDALAKKIGPALRAAVGASR